MRLEPDVNEIIVTHVDPGETLSEIAARYGVSVDALQRWNRIEDPDLLQIGQRIVVHKAVGVPESSTSEGAVSQAAPGPGVVVGSWDMWVGGAIVLALLLILFCRKRGAATPVSRAPFAPPAVGSHRYGSRRPDPKPAPVIQPSSAPKVNDGELLVRSELMRHYRDWMLLNDVLFPSGQGTTQIDHILVSPGGVFLIETKDMNGWVFGSPGQKRWTQSFAVGRWSRKVGIKSKQFTFYNPLLQNEGHAKALVNLGIVGRWWLRPIVVFVGDAELKTADKFLPFDEHEKIASRNRAWRMRGVICMSLADLHRYIDFSVDAPSNPGLTRQSMEMVCTKIRAAAIPVTADSHSRHVEFVRSVKEEAPR